MAFAAYGRNVYAPTKFVDLNYVFVQATIAGGSGAVTRDAANSSPETTITRDGVGQYSITFPKGAFAQVIGAEVLLAESAGSKLYAEAVSATAGTASFEAAAVPGTAADPADLSRIFITLLVSNS